MALYTFSSIDKVDILVDRIRLYLPVNHSGEYVHPVNCRALECWEYRADQPQAQFSSSFKAILPVLAYAFVRLPDDTVFYSFWNTIADMKSETLQAWGKAMYRAPELDIYEMDQLQVIGQHPRWRH